MNELQKLTAEQKQELENIKRLLLSGDWVQSEQGIELMRSLNDPALFDYFLEGTSIKQIDGFATLEPGSVLQKHKAVCWRLAPHAPEGSTWQGLCKQVEVADLSQTGLENMIFLKGYPNLKKLHAKQNHALKSLEGLENAAELEGLEASSTAIQDLLPLRNCAGLKELNVRHCKSLTSLAGLENCRKLEKLNAWNCTPLASLAGLENCAGLKELCVSDCWSLASLAGLENMAGLKELDVSGCKSLTSLAGLGNCAGLEELDVEGCTSLTSLAGLENAARLQKLKLPNDEWDETLLQGINSQAAIERLYNSFEGGLVVYDEDGD